HHASCLPPPYCSLPAPPQLYQGILKGLSPEQTRVRELQVEHDIHRHRDDGRKAHHGKPVACLEPAMLCPPSGAQASASRPKMVPQPSKKHLSRVCPLEYPYSPDPIAS